MEHYGHTGHDKPPNHERAEADNECILQTDDIAQAEDSRSCVYLKDELCLVSSHGAPLHHTRGKGLVPPSHSGDDKVVKTAYKTGDKQRLCLIATLCAAYEHLRRGSSLRERILAVHVLDEILAERNHKQDAENAAEQ